MFNDNIIRTPINGTAARVTSQGGCSDSESLEQERERVLSRVNWLSDSIGKRASGEVRSEESKAYGLEKAHLCLKISAINEKLKKRSFKFENRDDHMDCVYAVMKEQLSSFQYKQIMRLAREMFIEKESLPKSKV